MKYRVDKQEGYSILTLEEESLNSSIAPQFKSDLILMHNEGIKGLILDLTHVRYIDSSGLSAILTGHRMWKETGAFVLAGEINPMVTKLIEISRLDSILAIKKSLGEAVQHVKMAELGRELDVD